VQKLQPALETGEDRMVWRVAKGSLVAQTRQLQAEFTTHRVLDARRPKFGQDQAPVTADPA